MPKIESSAPIARPCPQQETALQRPERTSNVPQGRARTGRGPGVKGRAGRVAAAPWVSTSGTGAVTRGCRPASRSSSAGGGGWEGDCGAEARRAPLRSLPCPGWPWRGSWQVKRGSSMCQHHRAAGPRFEPQNSVPRSPGATISLIVPPPEAGLALRVLERTSGQDLVEMEFAEVAREMRHQTFLPHRKHSSSS